MGESGSYGAASVSCLAFLCWGLELTVRPLHTFQIFLPLEQLFLRYICTLTLELAFIEDCAVAKLSCVTNHNKTYNVSDFPTNKIVLFSSVEMKEMLVWRA